ncbi:MAG: class I SAM-dependent methyltransferase [Pseudonocardia sp.]
MLKRAVLDVLPARAFDMLMRVKRKIDTFVNARQSTEAVFTSIYLKNKWGGARGEFCSGSGTSGRVGADRYVDVVAGVFADQARNGLRVVDLGCGDFQIGRRLAGLADHYIGVDVVKSLVDHNRVTFGSEKIDFQHLDIVTDPLPEADICLVRQVLQHLSNAQIAIVLQKLCMYRCVLITEHHPADGPTVVPNVDKVHGADIRLYDGSGVYLSEAPFDIPSARLQLLLEVPASAVDQEDRTDMIRTYLYRPT